MIKLIRRLLELDDDDLRNCPDFCDMLDHLGMTEKDDIDDVRDAMELEVDAAPGEDGGDDVS